MAEFTLEPASPDLIEGLWSGFTRLPIVTVSRTYDDPKQAEAIVYRDEEGRVQGHVSFVLHGDNSEIVTLEALVRGQHIGGRLIDAAEEEMRGRGVRRIAVTTTNDNLRAQGSTSDGYRLLRIELGGMERVRALKPDVPESGHEGLPLRDMWEFEKEMRE